MKISLNGAELDALTGLPHSVICLYVMAIRPRMNYATGMVGVKPLISWHALTEWLYIEPAPGIAEFRPSRWAAMRAAWQLEKAGLVRFASTIANRQLIFECVLADRDKHAQNKAATNPQPYSARARPATGTGFTVRPARGEKGKPAIHPVSGFLLPHVLAASVSTGAKSRKNGAAHAAPSLKLNGSAHAAQSENPLTAKTVRQGKGAKPRPLTDAEIDQLPAAIKKHLQKSRAAKRRPIEGDS